MATSGSTDFTLKARELVSYALWKINIVPKGMTPDADKAASAMLELNLMLKTWMKHPAIWRLTEGTLTPVANQASISMAAESPYRVVNCRYRGPTGSDIPMEELTREEYYDLPTKLAAGTPTSWYFDPQRASLLLYVWPVLSSVSTDTIRVTYQRRFEDIDDLDNDIDIAQEHLETVGLNLAARLADSHGRQGPHIDRIIARADALEEEMKDADRPEVIRFVPEHRHG